MILLLFNICVTKFATAVIVQKMKQKHLKNHFVNT